MGKKIFILIITGLFIIGCNTKKEIKHADWTKFRGSKANSITEETGWNPKALKKPKILWTVKINRGYSSPVIKDKKLYVIGNDANKDTVYCLNIEDGGEIWQYTYTYKTKLTTGIRQYPGSRATPYIDNNKVYILSCTGDVYCLNADNGEVIWDKNLNTDFSATTPLWGFAGSPVIIDDILILNSNKYGIALNKKTGDLIWKSDENETGGYSTPVIYNNNGKKSAALFGEKRLYSIDVIDGKLNWEYPIKVDSDESNGIDPAIYDNKFFISYGYSNKANEGKTTILLELKDNKPVVIYENNSIHSKATNPVLIDNYIYCGKCEKGDDFYLACIDISTGKELWSNKIGYTHGSIIYSDGKIIALSLRGDLYIIEASPDEYKEIIKYRSRKQGDYWANPVLSNGKLFLRDSRRGELICIDLS